MKQRTKLFKKFNHLPVREITNEPAVILINGKIVDIGVICKGYGKRFRCAFTDNVRLEYFKKCLSTLEQIELYGKQKDGFYFILGWHKYTYKGSNNNRRKVHEIRDAREFSKETADNCFTGYHRSGDLRSVSAAIKVPKTYEKIKISKPIPADEVRCQAKTKNGTQCKNQILTGLSCWQHIKKEIVK